MANFAKVSKLFFRDPWYDPGRKYSDAGPYMWGTTGYLAYYDSAKVNGGKLLEESWKEFFEPRAELVGKIGALDDQLELYRAAAFLSRHLDPCTENPKEAQKILDLLLAQKPKLAMYNSQTGTIERMIAREVAMHHPVKERRRPPHQGVGLPTAVYVYPKEGLQFLGVRTISRCRRVRPIRRTPRSSSTGSWRRRTSRRRVATSPATTTPSRAPTSLMEQGAVGRPGGRHAGGLCRPPAGDIKNLLAGRPRPQRNKVWTRLKR